MSDEKYDVLNATVQAAIDGEEPRIFVGDPDGGEPRAIGPEELDAAFGVEEEMIEIEWLPNGAKVSITAPIDIKNPNETLTLTGTVRGTAAIPMGRDISPGYIVELDDTSRIPTDDGVPFEYTCVVFPIFIVTPITEGQTDDNG